MPHDTIAFVVALTGLRIHRSMAVNTVNTPPARILVVVLLGIALWSDVLRSFLCTIFGKRVHVWDFSYSLATST